MQLKKIQIKNLYEKENILMSGSGEITADCFLIIIKISLIAISHMAAQSTLTK